MQGIPARALLLSVSGLAAALLVLGCGLDSDDGDPAATSPPQPTATRQVEPTAIPTVTPTAEPELPTPTSTPEPEPTPEPSEPGDDFVQLQADLEQVVEDYWVSGNYAFAVTDLQTGETVSVRGDVPQMAGCIMNLFVIYQVVLDVEAGRYPLERIDSLVRATTWSSNAATAYQLYAIAGDGDATEGTRRVAELMNESLELEDMLLDHPPGYHGNSLGIDYNNWATVEATNQALAALWHGELLEGSRDYLLEVLGDVKPGLNYLTAAVPEGTVSHKNGFFYGDTGWVDNDVGIVQLQRGESVYAYAVSFFSEEVPTEYGDIVLGQQLGKLAYEAMLERYPLDLREPPRDRDEAQPPLAGAPSR